MSALRRRALTAVSIALALGCRDDAPVAPPLPRVVSSVAKVVVAAPRLVLEPGDSVRYSAQAFDAQGLVIPTATIIWSSSKPSVASVDARGTVIARTEGTAQILATADGQSGMADVSVSVTQLCDCTRIIDSTAMQLVERNDSTGIYVFRLTGNQIPAIDSGSIIVGAEDGGFLRRVQRVVRSGSSVTIQTTQAYVEDAVRDGAFAMTSFTEGDDIPFDSTAPRSGPWATTFAAPDLRMSAAGVCCKLDGLKISFKSKLDTNKTGTTLSASVDVTIKKGALVFDPRVDVGATIQNFRLQTFRTILGGNVGLNVDEYELSISGTAAAANKPFEFLTPKQLTWLVQQRPYAGFIGPMPVVYLLTRTLKLVVTPSITGSAVFAGRFRAGFDVTGGVRWDRSSGWTPVAASSSYFDAPAPEFKNVKASATVKIAVVLEYSLLFYGVAGPYVNLAPYLSATGAYIESHADGLVPTGMDWELKSQLGLDFGLGAKASLFGYKDLVSLGFSIPVIKPYTLRREFSDGPLVVHTEVTGPDQPDSLAIRLRPTKPDVYELGFFGFEPILTIPGPPPQGRDLSTSTQDRVISPNDSVRFENVRSGTSFKHTVGFWRLQGNCAAAEASPDTVAVKSQLLLTTVALLTSSPLAPTTDTLRVTCIALGALRVRTRVTGEDPVARSHLTLARRDTVGTGKGTPPVSMTIPAGSTPPDTVIDELVPLNSASGTNGRLDATLDPGRRNCAVAKPSTEQVTITSADTAVVEFRLTCVPLGHVMVRTVTTDPDSAPPSDAVTYQPRVLSRDGVDQITTPPATIAATGHTVVSGLVPLYNASGASGRHTVTLLSASNRCHDTAGFQRMVTVFPGDTAIAPFALKCVERLHVSTRSTGPASDRDGYIVVVDYADGSADSAAVGVNQTIGIAGVRPGMQTIRLAHVDPNCIAPASVNRQISGRDSTLVVFSVNCPGPPAPTGLRTTQILSNQVDLAWDAPPAGRRVGHYRLYRAIANLPGVVVIDSIGALAHSDAGLTPFTRYLYEVAAVDIDGVVGPRSAVLAVRTLDGTGPTAPGNLVAVAASASRINLTWTAASDPQSGVSRYRIYRGGALIDSASATSFADGGLTASTTYSYQVVAVNGQGLSGLPSNTVSATTLDGSPPTAPSGLSATPVSSTQINLAWTAATDPQSGIASYRVYRGARLVGTTTTTTFSENGLTPATSYTYEVSAVNGAGLEGSRAGPVTATTHAPLLGDVKVNVVSLGSGIPAAGYQVQLSASGVLLTQPIGSSGSVNFSGLVPQTYTVTLQNLPANCVVDDGPNPRSLVVTGGSTASTTFRVRCN